MEKRFVRSRLIALAIAVVLVLVMLLFTTGCNRAGTTADLGLTENANPPVAAGANSGEKTNASTTAPNSAETSSATLSEAEELIGEEAAKEKALSHAGISADNALFERVELGKDDGRWEYEVDFRVGNTEYDYEIDAVTGEVRESDRDPGKENTATSSKAETAETITAEKAKEAALSHAGVSADKARFLRAELDREDGKKIYEIEFTADGFEYDYDIDAETGGVLGFDKDRDD